MYLIKLLIATGFVTIFLRAFPFIAFDTGKKPPKSVTDLGLLISPAAIAMLVVYCYCLYFQNTGFAEKYYGLSEWLAGITVIAMHLLLKNPLVSIISGTVVYMLLTQLVFV